MSIPRSNVGVCKGVEDCSSSSYQSLKAECQCLFNIKKTQTGLGLNHCSDTLEGHICCRGHEFLLQTKRGYPHAQIWCLITIYQCSTLKQQYGELLSSYALLTPAKELWFMLHSCLFVEQELIKIVMSHILNISVYLVMCLSEISSEYSGIFINISSFRKDVKSNL